MKKRVRSLSKVTNSVIRIVIDEIQKIDTSSSHNFTGHVRVLSDPRTFFHSHLNPVAPNHGLPVAPVASHNSPGVSVTWAHKLHSSKKFLQSIAIAMVAF
jgi:hypothetical protein